jgi:polygalacturonase
MCTFSLYDTQNTILQNIVINAAQGCGVLENDGSGTIIDGIIIKRGEKPNGAIEERLLSINRDGFHLNGPKGGTIIKNCFIEFSGDDAINVRSSFGRITSVIGNIINFEPSFVRFSPGTDLYVYDQDTLTL